MGLVALEERGERGEREFKGAQQTVVLEVRGDLALLAVAAVAAVVPL